MTHQVSVEQRQSRNGGKEREAVQFPSCPHFFLLYYNSTCMLKHRKKKVLLAVIHLMLLYLLKVLIVIDHLFTNLHNVTRT